MKNNRKERFYYKNAKSRRIDFKIWAFQAPILWNEPVKKGTKQSTTGLVEHLTRIRPKALQIPMLSQTLFTCICDSVKIFTDPVA